MQDEQPPLYEVEEIPAERRLNPRDRREGKSREIPGDRRRQPDRRAPQPKKSR